MPRTVTVIGSGFSSLSAATSLADNGYDVTVLEKNSTLGGRARKFEADGFTFDMGPSWYWMPDVFEQYFNRFGKSTSDYYELKRLDPAYRVFFEDEHVDIPVDFDQLQTLFESREKGAGAQLKTFLLDASKKYDAGINDLVRKPSLNALEFLNWKVIKGAFQLNLFSSFHTFARTFFNDKKLLQIIEFPVLFLGAIPKETPALYSLMNYADLRLGTWYPMGGMHKIVEAMVDLAKEKGVTFKTDKNVIRIHQNGSMRTTTSSEEFVSDYIIGGADYTHIEKSLIDESQQQYSAKYWDSRAMAPSSLLFYVGVKRKVKNLLHHNLFFDADFGEHASDIYKTKEWPKQPLFYVCAPSKTDDSVAPAGYENLFFLVPIAAGIAGDTEAIRSHYFNLILDRIAQRTGDDFRQDIVYQKSYSVSDFKQDYNAFKGNAYGLANTLTQTAFLKPRIQHKKMKNLYYTGQLTVPGPGVPPAIISGQVVADHIIKSNR